MEASRLLRILANWYRRPRQGKNDLHFPSQPIYNSVNIRSSEERIEHGPESNGHHNVDRQMKLDNIQLNDLVINLRSVKLHLDIQTVLYCQELESYWS